MRLVSIAAIPAVVTLAACATAVDRPDPFGAGDLDRPVRVEVRNSNWHDMVIYASRRGGHRVRLGSVTSMSSGTFRLPATLTTATSAIRLEADPIGAFDVFRTESISIHGGETIRLDLRNHLPVSGYSVTY